MSIRRLQVIAYTCLAVMMISGLMLFLMAITK